MTYVLHTPFQEREGSDLGGGGEVCKADQRRLPRDVGQGQPLCQRSLPGITY